MAGNIQDHWMHMIPAVESKEENHRISLTIRSIVPGFEDELERKGLHGSEGC
jgi:hypothetical protein